MLDGVKNGYELPENISEEQYKYIREHKDEDSILTGFVGIASSFGGKWFGGYARGTDRNYTREGKISLWKDMPSLIQMNTKFTCLDYHDVILPDGCVVYADPPYNGTTNYRDIKFNSNKFWEYIKEVSSNHLVFISEQHAPEDFISIWYKQTRRTLDVNKNNSFIATENLYVYKDYYEMVLDCLT